MEPGIAKAFYESTDISLSRIRNGIIIFAQDREAVADLSLPIRELISLREDALAFDFSNVGSLAAECVGFIEGLRSKKSAAAEADTRKVLDLIAEIEATLLREQIFKNDVFAGISDIIEESFKDLNPLHSKESGEQEPVPQIGFEIDEETAEIFRAEAAELLDTISSNLEVLAKQPDDDQALWSLRRSIHTFKGAAGIVGMNAASNLAHRIEDLLGNEGDQRNQIDGPAIDLLKIAADCLNSMVADPMVQPSELATIYSRFDHFLSDGKMEDPDLTQNSQSPPISFIEPLGNGVRAESQSAPIVRVSLDKLDELQNIILNLAIIRASLAESLENIESRFVEFQPEAEVAAKIGSLMETQLRMTNELQSKLAQIRMVRFGMLSTRLSRAVHVTCHEENKKAEVVIENEDIELDTQVIDSLVEPLLHLLRNAVVHGIESPETRRMIGKPERGTISIRVKQTDNAINVSVIDDGRGIAVAKLKEKALSSGSLSQKLVDSMNDEEAYDLMFLRGVTTAETLSINAGRGVGMSIVRESVESGNGTISITSEAQKGTNFTICLPLFAASADPRPSVVHRSDEPELNNVATSHQSDELCVLIVDNSALMRQTITKVVEKAGWKAVSAPDGRTALDLLQDAAFRPNIIITDLEMPVLNGFELLEALKSDPQLSDIPVVMITSRSDRMHREKAHRMGAAKFLAKPFEGIELKSVIDQLCMVAV